MSALSHSRTGERGQALLSVLLLLSLGSVLIAPTLHTMSTGLKATRIHRDSMLAQYSADAGVEHAIWRIRDETGFAESLTATTPSVTYGLTVNGIPTTVTVEYVTQPPPPPPPDPGTGGIVYVSKTVDNPSGNPGQTATFTYTLHIDNIGTSTVHIVQIGDLLPPGFSYVAGSSSGITSAAPAITMMAGRQQLIWDLGSSPGHRMNSGVSETEVFRAEATIGWAIYYNNAWVIASPDSIDMVATGPSAPIVGAMPFDIQAKAGSTTVYARVAATETGAIAILSWQTR